MADARNLLSEAKEDKHSLRLLMKQAAFQEVKHESPNRLELNNNPQRASIEIQRVWRGYQARKKIALIMPSVLTHSAKLKLLNLFPSFSEEEIGEKLFAVHATNYFPEHGVIHVVDPKKKGDPYCHFRPTTHFALGEMVRDHSNGEASWENKRYAIITPLKDLIPQLLNLNVYDTFILGDFKLTSHSQILVPGDELEAHTKSNPHLNITGYDWVLEGKKLRPAVKDRIIRQGGYDVTTYDNAEEIDYVCPAFVTTSQLHNINTTNFFAPVLRQKKEVTVGLHVTTLLGIVDVGLLTLGFFPEYANDSWNQDVMFSKLIIKYALKKIENNSVFENHPGQDVLKLHLQRANKRFQEIESKNECNICYKSDNNKSDIAIRLSWPDLFLLMQTESHLPSLIYNMPAFLCLYAYKRTYYIGEKSAILEGLNALFTHNLKLLDDCLRMQVIGQILLSRYNSGSGALPCKTSYFNELLVNLAKKLDIDIDPFKLEIRVFGTILVRDLFWVPDEIDLVDENGNAPVIKALIARDEEKALKLLNIGANITNITANIPEWNNAVPLLTVALHYKMKKFINALLNQPHFVEWDQINNYQNTPLCDAIFMGLEDVAIQLIQRGANLKQQPNYPGIREKDILSLAYRLKLTKVVASLKKHTREIEPFPCKCVCLVM